MTLLFFLRSPASNTDTGANPGGLYWEPDIAKKRKKRDKKIERDELKAVAGLWDEADKEKRKKKRKQEEELLMMLFMHEFNGYDD